MRFSTIVVDPPWKVATGRLIGRYEMVNGKQVFGVISQKARTLSYPSMSVDEIAALPVKNISEEDSHLYLWTINRYLRNAFEIVDAWGFKYSTTLVWAKAPMGGGLGGCFGLASEFCLFARRGKLKPQARIGRNWFTWKRPYDERGKPVHSAKPTEFFTLVESISPPARLEMFARKERPQWDRWGNEISNTVEL